MASTSPPPDNGSSRRSSTVPLGHWASEKAKPPRDLDDVSHYAPALIKAIGKMGATELSMAMRSGSGVIADMCALAKVTGGDFAAFLHSRLPELEGDADALLYTSVRGACPPHSNASRGSASSRARPPRPACCAEREQQNVDRGWRGAPDCARHR